MYLAEGPWPGKAYFDALRRARQRDASTFIDYGYSRPNVISRGPVGQFLAPMDGSPELLESPTPVDQDNSAGENGIDEALPIPDPAAIDPTSATQEVVTTRIDLANLPVAENGVSFGFAELPAVEANSAEVTDPVSQIGFVEATPCQQPSRYAPRQPRPQCPLKSNPRRTARLEIRSAILTARKSRSGSTRTPALPPEPVKNSVQRHGADISHELTPRTHGPRGTHVPTLCVD